MSPFLQSMRLHQWVKNLFVLMPAFFAGVVLESGNPLRLLLGFLAFSLVASAIYVLNDLVDRKNDALHPVKKHRPLASGKLRTQQGWMLMGILMLAGCGLAYSQAVALLSILAFYFFINILYTVWLKRIAILDISIIAIGFLLRVFAGGVIVKVPISNWLIIMTFLLAMILALSKRRGEFIALDGKTATRKSLEGYNLQFIDSSLVFLSAVTVVAYLMYTLSEEVTLRIGSDEIYFTTAFVIIGLMRYLQLTLVFNKTESPTAVLWKDRFIQIVLISWLATFWFLLY